MKYARLLTCHPSCKKTIIDSRIVKVPDDWEPGKQPPFAIGANQILLEIPKREVLYLFGFSVVVQAGRHIMRKLILPKGRGLHPDLESAESQLAGVKNGVSPITLEKVYGPFWTTLKVQKVMCNSSGEPQERIWREEE